MQPWEPIHHEHPEKRCKACKQNRQLKHDREKRWDGKEIHGFSAHDEREKKRSRDVFEKNGREKP